MLGPIDYIVLGFEGNAFDGSIMSELSKASKNGIIRIVDLLFVIKDTDGNIIEGEFEDQTDELRKTFGDFEHAEDLPLLSDDDVAKVGEQMKNNTAACILVIEHVWATGLKQAIKDAGGFLIADGRVHPEQVEAALEDLQKTKA